MRSARGTAVAAAAVMAVLEVMDAPTLDEPAIALVFAALFLLGAWLSRRGGRAGPLLLVALSVIEVVFLPTYQRNNTFDWTIQAAVGAASGVCLVAAALVLLGQSIRGR